MASIFRWIVGQVSRSRLRAPVASVVTKLPGVVRVPVRIERGLWLLVSPRYEDLRYLADDKEPALRVRISELLSEGDTFVDAGAHIGYYSMLAADIVGQTGTVIAFEPHPDNARRLRQNAWINRFDVVIEQAAVTGRTGNVLLSEGESSLSHAVSPDRDGSTKGWALDEYFEADDLSPDVVKLDIEGSELDALSAMRSTLHTHQPTVLIEVHPWLDQDEVKKIYEILHKIGYRIETPRRQPLSASELLEQYKTETPNDDHIHVLARP